MGDGSRRARIIAVATTSLALVVGAGALATGAVLADGAADRVASVFEGELSPDLATFRAATIGGALLCLAALVLALLVVVATRRILFGLSALWSLAVGVWMAWWIVPAIGRLSLYPLDPPPFVAAASIAAVAAAACLLGSAFGWAVTPLGWDWLGAAPSAPPQSRGSATRPTQDESPDGDVGP